MRQKIRQKIRQTSNKHQVTPKLETSMSILSGESRFLEAPLVRQADSELENHQNLSWKTLSTLTRSTHINGIQIYIPRIMVLIIIIGIAISGFPINFKPRKTWTSLKCYKEKDKEDNTNFHFLTQVGRQYMRHWKV